MIPQELRGDNWAYSRFSFLMCTGNYTEEMAWQKVHKEAEEKRLRTEEPITREQGNRIIELLESIAERQQMAADTKRWKRNGSEAGDYVFERLPEPKRLWSGEE